MRSRYKKIDLQLLIDRKSDFSDTSHDSIPSDSTNSGLKADGFEPFFIDSRKVRQLTVPKYPYKPAVLKHYNHDLSKRWYVQYYAWNVATEKLQRVRQYDPLNWIKKLNERIYTGEMMVRIINGKLEAGKVLGKNELEKYIQVFNHNKITILEGMDFVIEQKKADGLRKNYYRTFTTVKTNLEEWLKHNVDNDYQLKSFDEKDARSFFLYLRDNKGLANKSINNIINNLGTAFKFLESQSGTSIWKKDPLRNVTVLPVINQKHPAYSDDQITIIKKEIEKRIDNVEYKQLGLFISFVYYLLARLNEICHIRIADIDLKGNRIFISGRVSKNKSDEYVEVSPQLKKAILASGVMAYPQDHYVFGTSGIPSKTPCYQNYFWRLHNDILDATQLKVINSRYSLYSYKHSGVISLYKATKDIKLIQRQCRHHTLEQTNTYLRDLGLLSDYDQLTKWKGAV